MASAHSTDPDVKAEQGRGGEGRKTSLLTKAEFNFLPSNKNVRSHFDIGSQTLFHFRQRQ